MRVLLDTNVLIHREASHVLRDDIGILFRWLDRLHYDKCVHPLSVSEIQQHQDKQVRQAFAVKLASYCVLQVPAPLTEEVAALSRRADVTQSDMNDSAILNEVVADRVDLLITEDRGMAAKAAALSIADRVFTIDSFLEKVTAENPALVDYKVLAVRKALFGRCDVSDHFFDSFRATYPGFDSWFNRKSEEEAYACTQDDSLVAFLYLKLEDEREAYPEVYPRFAAKRRLKIGTMKVQLNGLKLGERFMKIVFDNALATRVEEIYVTLFPGSPERDRLVDLLEAFGFVRWGEKRNAYGTEAVYVRDMTPRFNRAEPCLTYPYVPRSGPAFLVPIYQQYHTALLPDSILQTESPSDFVEHEPYRNAIRKAYVSRSVFRELKPGDAIVFYRTGGYYRGVVTTLGIVERVHTDIRSEDEFLRLCRRRSVFTDDELREQWRYKAATRPFIVDFVYAYSLPRRPNLAELIQHGVVKDIFSAPRGFERITNDQFATILRLAKADTCIAVD